MRNKSGDLYKHVFEEFHKIHSEEMKNVKKIFLKADDERAKYNGFERCFGRKGFEIIHQLCFFHWAKLYRKKFLDTQKDFFEYDESGARCKNYKYFLFVKFLPLTMVFKLFNQNKY